MEDVKPYFEFLDDLYVGRVTDLVSSTATPLTPEDGRGSQHSRPSGEQRTGARPEGGLPYLEQDRNAVTETEVDGEKRIELVKCGCRSWFCEACCLSKGIALKKRLEPELVKFRGLMMLTFTIDPELFTGPEEAYRFVKSQRCIAVTIQRLDRWDLLHSRRHISVIEWQKNGWPHWHVLVDAGSIPFDKLCEAWNRNWKAWESRVAIGRPGFGSVRFSKTKICRESAAGYVTAYLTKHAEHGYPDWVLQSSLRSVRRFEASRGFWSVDPPEEVAAGDLTEKEEACCDESGTAEATEQEYPRTIEQQIAVCGKRTIAFSVKEWVDVATGEVRLERSFLWVAWKELPDIAAMCPPMRMNERKTRAEYAVSQLPALSASCRPAG